MSRRPESTRSLIAPILSRLASALAVLAVLATAVFFLARLSPIDPARALVGPRASPAALAAARSELGYDQPLIVQLVRYIEHAVQGDFGISAVSFNPVASDIARFLPASLELLLCAFVLAILIGVGFGMGGALAWRGGGTFRVVVVIGSAVPVFLLAQLAILVFYQFADVLPATGRTTALTLEESGPTGFLLIDSVIHGDAMLFSDSIEHLILPALVLSIAPAVAIGRTLRSSLKQVYSTDYIRTARVKGVTEGAVLGRHALRNALNPVLTIGGIQIGALFGALAIVESIFAWPGVGLYSVAALKAGDFTTIAGVTLVLGLVFVVTNFIVDVLQTVADPRIRL